MKCIINVLLIICCASPVVFLESSAQTKGSLSVTVGAVFPMGTLADAYSVGYDWGVRANTSSDNDVCFAGGVLYSYYPGKKEDWEFNNAYLLKAYLGPRIGLGDFLYALPAAGFNWSSGNFRFGLDGVIGLTFSIGEDWLLDFSGRYEVQNLVGKEEGEASVSALHFGAGIGYSF